MTENIPWTEIEVEYVTSIEEVSLRQLAKKYNVTLTRLALKSKQGNWVDARKRHSNKVITDTEKQILKEQVERNKRNIKIVDDAIEIYVDGILGETIYTCKHCGERNKVDIPKIKPKFSDIDKLIRLQHFILGEPDQRIGVLAESDGKRFADMTHAEKINILNEVVTLIEEYEG